MTRMLKCSGMRCIDDDSVFEMHHGLVGRKMGSCVIKNSNRIVKC